MKGLKKGLMTIINKTFEVCMWTLLYKYLQKLNGILDMELFERLKTRPQCETLNYMSQI
jgi:hypothetical protein